MRPKLVTSHEHVLVSFSSQTPFDLSKNNTMQQTAILLVTIGIRHLYPLPVGTRRKVSVAQQSAKNVCAIPIRSKSVGDMLEIALGVQKPKL